MKKRRGEPELETTMRLGIGTALRALREDHQLYLQTAAEQAGVSYTYLSEIERGLKMPPLPTLFALCDLYGVLVSDLLASIYPFGTQEPSTGDTNATT